MSKMPSKESLHKLKMLEEWAYITGELTKGYHYELDFDGGIWYIDRILMLSESLKDRMSFVSDFSEEEVLEKAFAILSWWIGEDVTKSWSQLELELAIRGIGVE